MLLREATKIGAEETTADLHDRLSAMSMLQALERLNGLVPEEQPEAGVTCTKIEQGEARDWTADAVEVNRKIRGLSPFPGAWCEVAARG